MKRKKWLLLTGAGLVSIVLLACPAMAAEDPSVDISITESTSTPSDSVYQLPGESAAIANTEGNFQNDTLPYPVDIQLLPQGDLRYLHKTYTVAANYSPDLLMEEPFS